MRPIPAVVALLVLLSGPTVHAAGGLNLRWNACFGDAGAANKTFACNLNLGTNTLVGSFVPGVTVPQVSAVYFFVDIATASSTLPAWWQLKNAGSCRAASLTANGAIPGSAVICQDWANGQAAGGIASYAVGFYGPNTARITGAFAVAASGVADLAAGQEYFAFNVNFNNQKTAGLGACTGCAVPACVALNTVELYQNSTVVATLTGPSNGFDSHFVSWQGGGSAGGTCALGSPGGLPVVTSIVGRGAVSRSVNAANYPAGTPLTLTAAPKPGARFVAWSGDTTTTQSTLDVVVEHTLNYVATFDQDPAAAATLLAVSDVPADEGSAVTLSWARSPLDDAAYPAGTVCCYQLERRVLEPGGYVWLNVIGIPATHAASYQQDVATPTTASPVDSALFDYRVVTSAGDGGQWLSNVMDGAALDNIAPPDPASVTGSMASGIASMFWPAVSVPDFLTYRVYRAVDGVPPVDVAHKIATTPATGYVDSPGFFAHYVVTTVDVHLNESQGTVFVPVNPTGVDGRPAPSALAVGNPTPSPMGRQMHISLGLPREMNVTVDVLDPQGRLVRTLQDGASPPGWFNLAWDARDANGHGAAAGLYFVRVRTAGGERIKRLVVLP